MQAQGTEGGEEIDARTNRGVERGASNSECGYDDVRGWVGEPFGDRNS